MKVAVVGAGIFGVCAAVELRRRGHDVVMVDPGPLPHADAASTDISKLIRMDYGSDGHFTAMMEVAFDGWHAWNRAWGSPLYHPDGMLVLGHNLDPGTFEGDSYRLLQGRGHALEQLERTGIETRFPAWQGFSHGYVNANAGWAESGAVVNRLVSEAQALGVRHLAEVVTEVGDGARPSIAWESGSMQVDAVVVAAGSWTPKLLPELADRIRAIGQPVLHFAPEHPADWRSPDFLPWAADISNTGWYGFPSKADGVLKVANHGPGLEVDPGGDRPVAATWEARFRGFFAEHLRRLEHAPLVAERLCVYADSFDGDFFIDAHPGRAGVFVASGGSGHGFKFAPLLGPMVANAVEGRPDPWSARFRWRELGARRSEDARFEGG